VRTHVDSSVEAERLPAICGKATLATEESSTTMKVASITETATIHGFTEGRHSMGAAAVFGDVVLTI
jgi:hypothetical protein